MPTMIVAPLTRSHGDRAMIRLAFTIRCLIFAAVVAGTAVAQDEPKSEPAAKAKSRAKSKAPRRPAHADSGGTYMGREIAEVMTYIGGADWLIRPEREEEEEPEKMLDALKIKPGDTVADVGAGVGYTSARISKRVGAKGTVLATDIQPQMVAALRANMKSLGIKNVKPILCTATETKLPDGEVDLALMVDVYHECSDPEAVLKGLRKALKPGGRLVLVEFRAEDPDVPIKPEHKMTVDQVRKEIEPQGFKFRESVETLPWQHVIIFEKPKEKDRKETPDTDKKEAPAKKKAEAAKNTQDDQ